MAKAAITDPQKVPFIKGAIKSSVLEGRSGASVLKGLKGTSLAIREQDFYRLRREVIVEVETWNKMKAAPVTQVIIPELAVKRSAKGNIKYSFVVNTNVYDKENRFVTNKDMTFNFETRRTKEEVLAAVTKYKAPHRGGEYTHEPIEILESYYHE